MIKKLLSLFITTVFSFNANIFAQTPQYVPTKGLIAWYSFNGNANDETGNSHDGVVNGATLIKDKDGNENSAYSFDGVNDNIVIPYDAELTPVFPFSISFYGKTNNPSTTQTWVSTNPFGVSQGWDLMPFQNGGMNYEVAINNNWNSFVSDYKFPTSTWVHCVYVFNETNISVYINGELLEQKSMPNGEITYGINPLVIGSTTTGGNWLNGAIDNLGIWDKALTLCEIQKLYNTNDNIPILKNSFNNCPGKNIDLTATEGANYKWNTGAFTSSISVSPNDSTIYFVEVTDTNGCKLIEYDSVLVFKTSKPIITIDGQSQDKYINICTGGFASSNSHWGSNIAENAFDGDTITSGWGSNGDLPVKPVKLVYDFGVANPQIVNAYSIYCSSNTSGGWGLAGYDPYQWTFEGFDGVNWSILDARIDSNRVQNVWKHYYFSNSNAFQAYRIHITNGNTSSYVMITELRMGYIDFKICNGNKLSLTSTSLKTYNWNTSDTKSNIEVAPKVTTTFTLSGTDQNGCLVNNLVPITVLDLPSKVITQTVLDSYTLNGQTYQTSGTYLQQIPNSIGCDSLITLNLTINTVTSLTDVNQNTFFVSPNPVIDHLTINTQSNNIGNIYEITDLVGKILLVDVIDANVKVVNLSDLSSGIYFVKIQGKSNEVIKFIKE